RRDGDPRLRPARVVEPGRHHTHDPERPFTQREHPVEDVDRSAVPALPQAVADHEYVLRPVEIVVAIERSPPDRLNADGAEEVARDRYTLEEGGGGVLDREVRPRAVVVDAGYVLEQPAMGPRPTALAPSERGVRPHGGR